MSDVPATSDAAEPAGIIARQGRLVRLDVAGTVVFVATLAVAVPLRAERVGQVLIGAVSVVLFAIGVATSLWAYVSALERSRAVEVGDHDRGPGPAQGAGDTGPDVLGAARDDGGAALERVACHGYLPNT